MGACKSLPAALGYSDSELTAPGFVGERVGVNSFIDGAEGTSAGPHKIHVVSWLPPTAPRAVVIICHGLHEHALRHYRMAHALTSRGVAVYGCDHFAHGRSDGERGLVADYRVLIEDFIKFATWAKSQHPGVPVSLFGHSMGAMISSICVNKIGDINSVIFSANPIHPGPGSSSPQGIKLLHSVATSRLGRSLADVLAAVDPKGPAGPIDIDGITVKRQRVAAAAPR